MKKAFLLLLVTCSIMVTACDSLWSVGEKTDVLFNINLAQYINGGESSSSRAVVPDSGDGGVDFIESHLVIVSIHKTSDNSIIESETLSFAEAQSTDVSFSDIPLHQKVYAKIEVFKIEEDEDEYESFLLFTARTLDTTLRRGENVLIAKPSVVFIDNYTVYYGYGSGFLSANSEIYNSNKDKLDAIYNLMSVDGQIVPGATVLVGETLMVSTDETWDYPGLTLKRKTENYIVELSSGTNLTLKNITIDGNSQQHSAASQSGILVPDNTTLNIYNGTVIKNNSTEGGSAILVSSGTLNMYGGSIINNFGGFGSAVNVFGLFNMTGGTITGNKTTEYGAVYSNGGSITMSGKPFISGNTNDDGGKSNVYLENGISINLSNSLDDGASIWVTSLMPSYPTIARGDNLYTEIDRDAKKFFSDDPLYKVVYEEGENTISLTGI